MADWPKHLLEKASKVRIESEGYAWEVANARAEWELVLQPNLCGHLPTPNR